ncbi:hypothetical protein P171DRAFT_142958 [Karstenula rhodostoma CBS 690.94]|uniref:Uncharacterized protein n=1 Tax=Karstenula rhodostoma CBS 690.94 TaxID=1392251 RepID=A0A9P4PSN8_9PLEO|nr:hypothetical protein P171DRAFT_142958 [Karstenula rhodostoma CBS 690.94]
MASTPPNTATRITKLLQTITKLHHENALTMQAQLARNPHPQKLYMTVIRTSRSSAKPSLGDMLISDLTQAPTTLTDATGNFFVKNISERENFHFVLTWDKYPEGAPGQLHVIDMAVDRDDAERMFKAGVAGFDGWMEEGGDGIWLDERRVRKRVYRTTGGLWVWVELVEGGVGHRRVVVDP